MDARVTRQAAIEVVEPCTHSLIFHGIAHSQGKTRPRSIVFFFAQSLSSEQNPFLSQTPPPSASKESPLSKSRLL
uniref:Uncharacterized protein n=1 Tax=Nelumbo nucifera TaxID=4432 RepID=A0A822YME3_NELNU|nr:TPA_asm: hypothetical protein HUJ06_012621 [Nelumbo nucifera]